MKKSIFIISFVFIMFFSINVLAHSGRTDSYGGHYVRTAGKGYPVGTYHYHSGPYTGYTVSYQGEVPAALKAKSTVEAYAAEEPKNIEQPKAVEQPKATAQEVSPKVDSNPAQVQNDLNGSRTSEVSLPKVAQQDSQTAQPAALDEPVQNSTPSSDASSSNGGFWTFIILGGLAAVGINAYKKRKA